MKNRDITLKIPNGFTILEKKRTVDAVTACKLLNSRRLLHYTRAERHKENYEITWHVIRCPYCGRETPAYLKYLQPRELLKGFVRKKAPEEFVSQQLSFYDTGIQKTFLVQNPIRPNKFHCPRCGLVSTAAEPTEFLTVKSSDSVVSVEREIPDFSDLMEIDWINELAINDLTGLREKLVFDFEQGRTYLQIVNETGVCKQLDLTETDSMPTNDILEQQLKTNIQLKMTLRTAFQRRQKEPLPFALSELELPQWILLTQFQGFPRAFYDQIPFSKENPNALHGSFIHIAEQLRTPEAAMAALKNSSLPDIKSVRKLFLEHPGYFFYLKECAMLYGILQDPNLLCRALQPRRSFMSYLTLGFLHRCPGAIKFYQDYARIMGAVGLCRRLESKKIGCENYGYIENYVLSEPDMQEAEHRRWKEKKCHFVRSHQEGFCLPIAPMPPEDIPNSEIDGFSFRWLRSEREYAAAGKAMSNCLGDWEIEEGPVLTVTPNLKGQKGIPVAAVEVESYPRDAKLINQALEAGNKRIEKGSPLYLALRKWCERFNVFWDE